MQNPINKTFKSLNEINLLTKNRMYVYHHYMRGKRLRTKLFQVWLHEKEYEFLNNYAESNLITGSELIRFWIQQAMKEKGLLDELRIETRPKKKGGK